MYKRKKAIISACLLGEYCRYDGKTKKVNDVVEAFKDYEIIPFCPEDPLFGTPREKINLVQINNKKKILTDTTNKDVTSLLENEINFFIKQHPTADMIVLKSKSPSCGLGTTAVINKEKNVLYFGDGLATSLFKKHYKSAVFRDEKYYLVN